MRPSWKDAFYFAFGIGIIASSLSAFRPGQYWVCDHIDHGRKPLEGPCVVPGVVKSQVDAHLRAYPTHKSYITTLACEIKEEPKLKKEEQPKKP